MTFCKRERRVVSFRPIELAPFFASGPPEGESECEVIRQAAAFSANAIEMFAQLQGSVGQHRCACVRVPTKGGQRPAASVQSSGRVSPVAGLERRPLPITFDRSQFRADFCSRVNRLSRSAFNLWVVFFSSSVARWRPDSWCDFKSAKVWDCFLRLASHRIGRVRLWRRD